MAVRATRITVGTTPTALTTAEGRGTAGSGFAVRNMGPNPMVVGGATVAMADGFPVAVDEDFGAEFEVGEVIYAVVATGTTTVAVIQAGV